MVQPTIVTLFTLAAAMNWPPVINVSLAEPSTPPATFAALPDCELAAGCAWADD